MSDSEEYSSGEDEDYLPSGEDYSEDDVNELVEEDEHEEKQSQGEKCKKGSKGITGRKRCKGGGLSLELDGETSKDDASDSKDGDDLEESCPVVKEEEKKKKEDALWASFLSDVGQKPRAAATDQATCVPKDKPAEKNACKPQEVAKEPTKPKVAITEVFDFAGEEVRITKEVDASSKEAQVFLQKQEQKAVSPVSHPTGSGVKRPSGLNSLLGKLGPKKQKMSTLEKSKLDWEHFKEQEGIGEELAIHNRGKEGYLERKAFLERVDHRQFEIERDIRLSTMKP
ncbi:PREDICTED: craniofacial development protein 1 [Gekko japonicus]|uniref:Craniofacial development protein 1 n=1 Tax=Gekko japonicus TaxID=146911 RepID=A0ABM1JQK8_GEKJA|nr:PREDICTED: craniofacial development protein 1 [Gekko japonicus]